MNKRIFTSLYLICLLVTPVFAETGSLIPAKVIGVTEGSVYKGFVKPTWEDAGGALSSATLTRNAGQPVAYTKGAKIEDDGKYLLNVTTRENSSGLTANRGIHFTIDSNASKDVFVTNAGQYDVELEVEYEVNSYSGKYLPLYTMWVEDGSGNYLHNLYVSAMPATNIMRYTDKYVLRPQSVPYWAHKACPANPYGKETVYHAANNIPPDLDAVSGATAKADFFLKTRAKSIENKLKILFEINRAKDESWFFNRDFSYDKYYPVSMQPSLVYSVLIDLNHPRKEYDLELTGFGHYAGRDGDLYTDFEAMDPDTGKMRNKFESALNMVKSIKVRLKSNRNK